MKQYQIVTSEKVKRFIEKLDNTRKVRIDRVYDLFEEYGPFFAGKVFKKNCQKSVGVAAGGYSVVFDN